MNKLLQKHGWYNPGYCARWGKWTKSRDWHHPVHSGIITERQGKEGAAIGFPEWCHWRKQNVFGGSNQFLLPGSKMELLPAKKSLKIYLEQLDAQLKAA